MGDEDEDPDEVISEPRDVEGDFMARCSSGLIKKGEFNKLVLILSLQEHYSKNRQEFFFLRNCLKVFRRLELQKKCLRRSGLGYIKKKLNK